MSATCILKKCVMSSPIGNLTVTYCKEGLHDVSQITMHKESFEPSKSILVKLIGSKEIDGKCHVIQECLRWFRDYFTDPGLTVNREIPRLCTTMTDGSFRDKVRTALVEHVKAGSTISYGGLAKLVSNKGASRAVGSAMSNNPFSIIVPCHRVIKSDGTLGNYGKGCRNDIKEWLLEFEGIKL